MGTRLTPNAAMTKRSWFGRCVDVVAARMGRTSDQPVLRIGGRRLHLRLDNKHEIAYFEKARAGIDDVDVAIARRLLRKGDAALDLGANIGFVSLHLLALGASQVQAFEPNPEIYQRLESLQCAALQCHSCAVGATSGFADLILSVSHHQGATLYPEVVGIRPKVFGSEPQTVRVEVRPIDSLFPQTRFDYIKVDIEGGELDFVRGATRLLTERPPRVLILEIKPEFLTEYLAAMSPYLRVVRRVDYDKASGSIRFVEVDQPSVEPFRNQPPNYVFTDDSTLFN